MELVFPYATRRFGSDPVLSLFRGISMIAEGMHNFKIYVVETNQYYFFETDIFKIFSPIFVQLSIFDWPSILYSKICLSIFLPIFWQSILVEVGADCLQPW